jgi:hypothetical protein
MRTPSTVMSRRMGTSSSSEKRESSDSWICWELDGSLRSSPASKSLRLMVSGVVAPMGTEIKIEFKDGLPATVLATT